MRILIAEDDELVRKLLTSFLNEEGHETKSASNGMELIKLALKKKPDLIFTDLHMPNMNGDTMIAMIEMYPVLSGIPMVVITGATKNEIKNMALNRDIPVLSKPPDFEKISMELERIKKKLG